MTDGPKKPRPFGFDTRMEFDSGELRHFLDLWNARRGSRLMPRRADLPPEALLEHLGWIGIVRVSHDPIRFRFTLYGTRLVEITGRDVTGKYLEDVFDEQARRQTQALGELMVRERTPVRMHSTLIAANKDFLDAETLFVPLSEDGETADTLMFRQAFLNR